MPEGFSRSLAALRGSYGRLTRLDRAYILGRLLTCPIPQVVATVPPGARVLDIGAGHGIFARLVARGGARQVVAIEPDLRKAALASLCPAVRVVAGSDVSVTGSFDVIAMIDVLYKVRRDDWDALFARIFRRLCPGGLFLLKEMDPEHRVKAGWNWIQERVANATRLTLGHGFNYETREQVRVRLATAGFVDFRARDLGAWYPHAHVLYSARRPPTEAPPSDVSA
ncbi:MAG: SAM-dependent methyltransferase [Thermoanaerobaculales bacterium]